jgi:hypothetical protein
MKYKNTNSLKTIINEVMSEKNILNRLDSVTDNVLSIDETTIDSLIHSRVFTLNEQRAMKILFTKTKTKSLNENVINELDNNIRFITKASEMEIRLKEGFFGDIWDGLKGLGEKGKDAITGGWSKLKAIWVEFKELVQEVINSAKNGLLKLCNMTKTASIADAQNMVKDLASKGKLKIDDDFKKELLQLKESSIWWTTEWYQKWIVKPFWEKDVLSGKGNVDEEPKIDSKEAEKGLETIPALEGLIKKKNSLLSNYNIVSELLKRNRKRNSLKEAHAVEHLDDAIKNPALRKVVHYAVELIQWAFIPFAKLGQIIGKWVGPKLLSSFSNTTKIFGGPGIYTFELLGTIFGELLEIVVKKMATKYATGMIKDIMFPGFGLSENVVDAIHNALLLWTIANILINLVDSAEKEGGSTQESYKSSGKFKIQDGNLLYLK